jgi:hypothetical protein
MKGFEKYSKVFISKAKELLTDEDLKQNKEYQEAFKNHLLGLNGPKQMERKLSPADIFYSKFITVFEK